MNKIICLLGCLFLSGCANAERKLHEDFYAGNSVPSTTLDELIVEFLKKAARKEHYEPISFATDLDGEVQKIFIKLQAVRTLNIPQSRKLIVEKAEEFLALLNRNPKVDPYFREYPCRIPLLTLKIEFVKPDCSPEEAPYVASVKVQGGKIYYVIHSNMQDSDTTTVEPYAEAYQIVLL